MFRIAGRVFLIISLLATLAFTGCSHTLFMGDYKTVRGSSNVIEEIRNLSGFSGVSLATTGHLSIETGDTESLRIIADDNLMDLIETEVNDGELSIRATSNVHLKPTRSIRYYLTVADLNSISIYSSGDIQAPYFNSEDFAIAVGSSGNLDIEGIESETLNVSVFSSGNVRMGILKANILNVNINSSGDLDIAGGEVKTQNIILNSSGNYSAPNLACDRAQANLNSSGSATIRVYNHLTANLNSSGDLRYHGDPNLNTNKNSSGDVIKID